MKNKTYLDNPSTTIARKRIIKKKLFLYTAYVVFYKKIARELFPENKKGKVVELGSGAGFIKKIIPHAITSDILKLPQIDLQFSATRVPFKKNSINAFIMIDVFHHISNVEKFLTEADRCLKKNGQIIMIEPASSILGKFIYKYFHHELYDQHAQWAFLSSGPLSGANSALPWIVFIRDRAKFQKKFPHLSINKIATHTPLLYLLSGGFTYPQLLPNYLLSFVKLCEVLLTPLHRFVGLFYTVTIVKKK